MYLYLSETSCAKRTNSCYRRADDGQTKSNAKGHFGKGSKKQNSKLHLQNVSVKQFYRQILSYNQAHGSVLQHRHRLSVCDESGCDHNSSTLSIVVHFIQLALEFMQSILGEAMRWCFRGFAYIPGASTALMRLTGCVSFTLPMSVEIFINIFRKFLRFAFKWREGIHKVPCMIRWLSWRPVIFFFCWFPFTSTCFLLACKTTIVVGISFCSRHENWAKFVAKGECECKRKDRGRRKIPFWEPFLPHYRLGRINYAELT